MKEITRLNIIMKPKSKYSSPVIELTEESDHDIICTSSNTPQPETPIKPPNTGEWDPFYYDEYAW